MKIHAHFGGAILCGQANAKNIPLKHWEKLPETKQCRQCRNAQIAKFYGRYSSRREAKP